MTAETDLLHQEDVTELVKTAYANLDQGGGFLAIEHMYSAAELEPLPLAAVDWALGVGNPVRHAGLQLGQTVLDVGSGGGIDSILAARHVGPAGNVVGLDILPEMTARAAEHARAAGVGDRCSFVVGQMEAIPLPDASVDVVISNGVINLSPRKGAGARRTLPYPASRRPFLHQRSGGRDRATARGADERCCLGGLNSRRCGGACLRQEAREGWLCGHRNQRPHSDDHR